MFSVLWSAKGGSGTSVVAAAMAVRMASAGRPVVLLDLAGELPTIFGQPTVAAPGLADWLAAGRGVPVDALDRMAAEVAPSLRLLTRGRGPLPPDRGSVVASLLRSRAAEVIVDAGTRPGALGRALAAEADRSVLVTRLCFLALRRLGGLGLRPTDVLAVVEAGRALSLADVEAVAGAPVLATIPVDEAIARAVDAGLLTARLPRVLDRALRPLDPAAA